MFTEFKKKTKKSNKTTTPKIKANKPNQTKSHLCHTSLDGKQYSTINDNAKDHSITETVESDLFR